MDTPELAPDCRRTCKEGHHVQPTCRWSAMKNQAMWRLVSNSFGMQLKLYISCCQAQCV
jgi:hypothetical protein